MSLKFRLPCVVTDNYAIDDNYRFNLGSGYFEGTSPLKFLNSLSHNVISVPFELFYAVGNGNTYYSSDDAKIVPYPFSCSPNLYSAFLIGNKLFCPNVMFRDENDNLESPILSNDLTNVVGDFSHYSTAEISGIGKVGNRLIIAKRNTDVSNLVFDYGYIELDEENNIIGSNFRLMSDKGYFWQPFGDDFFAYFYEDGYPYLSLKVIKVSDGSQVNEFTKQSVVSNSALTVDQDTGNLFVMTGSTLREISALDGSLLNTYYLKSLSNVVFFRAFIRISNTEEGKYVLQGNSFVNIGSPLPLDLKDKVDDYKAVYLYKLTDTGMSYVDMLMMPKGYMISSFVEIESGKFLFVLIEPVSFNCLFWYVEISDNGFKTQSLEFRDKFNYKCLACLNGKVFLFSDSFLEIFKTGMAERAVCDVQFEDTYVYPRSGTLSIKAYDLFGNESYARILVKLVTPNVTFDDGTTAKVVRFYPNNDLTLSLKLLYSSDVVVKTKIIEVLS